MEKIDIAELAVGKQLSVGTRLERASAQCSETIMKENLKLSKYLMAAGAVFLVMLAAQFGMNIFAVSLEKEVFVKADGTGPQTLQDRAGNPLTMPVALERIEPFEGLALMGPEAWDATTNVALLSEDGTLHGFRLSGWRLEEDKTEVGVYQLTLTTLSGATLTYARPLRPRPAAGAHAPFEWVSSGANVIRIQSPDGGNTLALQEGSGRRLQATSPKCDGKGVKDKDACNEAYDILQKAKNLSSNCEKTCTRVGKDECFTRYRCQEKAKNLQDAQEAFDLSYEPTSTLSDIQDKLKTAKTTVDKMEASTAAYQKKLDDAKNDAKKNLDDTEAALVAKGKKALGAMAGAVLHPGVFTKPAFLR